MSLTAQASVPVATLSCAPAAMHRPMLLVPFDDARLISLLQLLSFRHHARTPVGSVQIAPLWLSCPIGRLRSGILSPKQINPLLFLQSGATSDDQMAPIQISEINHLR